QDLLRDKSDAHAALRTATTDLEDAKRAHSTAKQVANAARDKHAEALSAAEAVRAQFATADALATSKETSASGLEQRAKADMARYENRVGVTDQHFLMVAPEPDRLEAHQRARDVWRTASFIVPKPAETSQDALALAPEVGRFAIADGTTNSDF